MLGIVLGDTKTYEEPFFFVLRPLHSGWFVLAVPGLREFENVETKTVTVDDGQHLLGTL